MAKKKDRPEAPATFVDEQQVDEIQQPVPDEQEPDFKPEPEQEKTGANSALLDKQPVKNEDKNWVVGANAISGTRKGIIDVGHPVKAEYFKHGWETMNQLIKDGAIVEAEK